MPGYLPEVEPVEFDSFKEAKKYIVEELFRYMHELYDAGELDDGEAEQTEIEILILE